MADRALVLHTAKSALDEAKARHARRLEYLDLKVGRDVPAFAPDRDTLAVTDKWMAQTPFQHVIATSESNVAFAGFLRSRYGLAGMNQEQAVIATNKLRMKQVVRDVLPTARYWLSGEFLALTDVPSTVVVKPLSGSASKGVRLTSGSEARDFLGGEQDLFLIEEALAVDAEFHCNGVVRDGLLTVALPCMYDRPVLRAAGTTRASINLPECDPRAGRVIEAARRVVAALPLSDFVFHLELIEAAGELHFGEIGLRPPGGGNTQSLRLFRGIDLWEEFIRVQTGMVQSTQEGEASGGYTGVIGVAAGVQGGTTRELSENELMEVPGIVKVESGSTAAHAEARLGSSCAFTHLAFFDLPSEDHLHATISRLQELTRSA